MDSPADIEELIAALAAERARAARVEAELALARAKAADDAVTTHYVGLDVSQRMTAICVVDEGGHRLWRGQCRSVPDEIPVTLCRYAGEDARIGVETGAMTPWLVHELRQRGLDVVCLDARHARAALKMQINKTDQNDAEGLAQIMRTGWYRPVHVKSFEAHRARSLVGARSQLVGMTTRLSNHIRGVLKTFGLLPGGVRGLPFDRRVEALLEDRPDLAPIVRPMLEAWRQLREQIGVFDQAIRKISAQDAHRPQAGFPDRRLDRFASRDHHPRN